jgi:hypothetical protein
MLATGIVTRLFCDGKPVEFFHYNDGMYLCVWMGSRWADGSREVGTAASYRVAIVMIKDWYFAEFGKVLTRQKPEEWQ